MIPAGSRLYAKQGPCAAVGVPFRKTTERAAQLSRACQAPAGVAVMVRCDAASLCHTVINACRESGFHVASTAKRHRSLVKRGWQHTAGRSGRNLLRRRRTDTLDVAKPSREVRYRFVDAGWRAVSQLGPLPVVCSRTGTANKILGLVTDAPELAAADVIRTYDKR